MKNKYDLILNHAYGKFTSQLTICTKIQISDVNLFRFKIIDATILPVKFVLSSRTVEIRAELT